MKQLIIACALVALIAGHAFGQDLAKNEKSAEKKPVAPVAKTINDQEDIKAWQVVQSPINENQAVLNQLMEAARQAKPKDAAAKAGLWSDLETALLRGQRDGAAYDAFLAKMQTKYDCKGCVIAVAPDGQTLVLKPAPPKASTLSYSN